MTLALLMEAKAIPDGSEVSKRTGENRYTLRKQLTVYPEDKLRKAGTLSIVLDGYFLLGRGVNQVAADTLLHWHIDEDSLAWWLRERSEGTPQ